MGNMPSRARVLLALAEHRVPTPGEPLCRACRRTTAGPPFIAPTVIRAGQTPRPPHDDEVGTGFAPVNACDARARSAGEASLIPLGARSVKPKRREVKSPPERRAPPIVTAVQGNCTAHARRAETSCAQGFAARSSV